jgi:hypothetical protein
MRTSIAQNDGAVLPLMFGLQTEVGDRRLTGVDLSSDPAQRSDGESYASVFAHSRLSHDRETIVNRVLDWAEEARARGRVRRAEYLVCLAWEAYDRVPG